MEKKDVPLTFSCPVCKETFEFDYVGEYELVFCPVCGIDFMTVRKNQTLVLESLEAKVEDSEIVHSVALMDELKC
jgi:Zn finger protein HypA/HybF involved in hydrogenase expression